MFKSAFEFFEELCISNHLIKTLFMKNLFLTLCMSMFAIGAFANESLDLNKIAKNSGAEIQCFENGFAVAYGCSVYIAWHDSHGSYSNTWSFPNVNSQSGCNQMMRELLAVLQEAPVAYPLDPEEGGPIRFIPEEPEFGTEGN